MVGLVDCNSFYASCEKVFRPDLRNIPVAVLSNNDGCIVAMSRELKAGGIKRGAPYFMVRDRLKALGAAVFSSNYALYQDMSNRVMAVIRSFGISVEVYSIDEAFIFTDMDGDRLLCLGRLIQEEVLQTTGIPVSVGFGRTKTLAKIANRFAKKEGCRLGNYLLTQEAEESALSCVAVADIWGIGTRKGRFLMSQGVSTAAELRNCQDNWIRRHLTLVTLKTVWELRGTCAVDREVADLKKEGILSSLGFGQGVTELSILETALTAYAATAVRKLQEQESEASRVLVFLQTSRFREPCYANSIIIRLPVPTCYLPDIVTAALQGLRSLYIEGFLYAKTGILLDRIDHADRYQLDLFETQREKKRAAAKSFYEIQKKHGLQSITCRSGSYRGDWNMQRQRLSQRYTTCWAEIPVVT